MQLTSDHPIVTEWSKVYDMVIKFRDALVAMFTESGPCLAGLVEDLQAMEVHQLDRSQEVQGQITQMRSVGPTPTWTLIGRFTSGQKDYSLWGVNRSQHKTIVFGW